MQFIGKFYLGKNFSKILATYLTKEVRFFLFINFQKSIVYIQSSPPQSMTIYSKIRVWLQIKTPYKINYWKMLFLWVTFF